MVQTLHLIADIHKISLIKKDLSKIGLNKIIISVPDTLLSILSVAVTEAVLADTVEPGDSIVIFKMGPLNFEESLLFDGRVDDVVQAVIPPSPTFIPSVI